MRSRHLMLGIAAALVVAILVTLLVAWRDTTRPVLREVSIPVDGLRREVTILHASDLHGRSFGAEQRELEALLGDRHFDAAVLTGDLEGEAQRLSDTSRRLVALLGEHSDGVFAVHGNHESADNNDALASLGVTDLSIRAEPATIAPDAGRIALVGTFWLPYSDALEEDVVVGLSHQPPTADEAKLTAGKTNGARVLLAGHTHGGQVRLPLLGAIWVPQALSQLYEESGRQVEQAEWLPDMRGRTTRGLYRLEGAWVNVSAGLGTEFLPIRLFNPAEMTVVRLVPPSTASE